MAAPADLRLALTALRKGLITRDQLSTFLAEREGDAPGPALAQQLVERGILTAEQVRALEAEAVPGGAADAQTMVADGLPLPRGPGQGVDYRTKVGEYSLIKVLGRGGMGVVYQAEHEALRRKVALKVLPPAFSRDERALARFLREVRAAARLHHTGIVPIYDFGRDGDTYFFAMEFVEGPTLEQELERGALEPKRAARLLAQAAEALHVAHLEGIVHRDIKPSNLIIAAGDRIVITDFGIAREITESGLTASGSMLGTPYYMSPEQASGTHGLPDARSDVYSLGATLYEAATAHKAFEAPSFELVLARVLLAEPDPPRTHRPELPRDLETVTLKAMAKDAGLRSQTALELAEDLRRFERGEPVLARSVTRIERIGRTLRRLRSHRGVLLAAALALGALGSLAVRLGVERSQLETEKAAEAERAAARAALEWRTLARARRAEESRSLVRQADLLRSQSFADALKVYDQAVAVDKEFHEPLLARAGAYSDEGMYKEASRDLTAALALKPDCVEAYAARGLIYFWLQDPLRAAADAAQLLRLKPDHPYAVLYAGAVPYITGDLAAAEKAFRDATRATPKNALAWACLGGTLVEAGKDDEAIAALDKALGIDPRNFMALSNRAGWHLAHRRYEEALADAIKAVEVAPSFPLPYLVRGKAYLGLAKFVQAQEDLDKAVKRMPKHGDAWLTRARLRYRLRDYLEAAKDGEKAVRLKWALEESRTLCGLALARAGDPVGALEQAEAMEAADASSARAAAVRGAAYLASGDPERAAGALDGFLESHPDAALPHLVRAQVFAAEKNWGRAYKHLMTAVRIDPDLKEEAQEDLRQVEAELKKTGDE